MLEKLERIITNTQDFKDFQDKAKRGDLAKTIMLISKDNDFSYEFARLLSCLIFDEGEIGESENYLKVKSNAHPDLKIYPQKDRLLVADSEDIVFESAVKPIFAKKKVFIIRDIDKGMEPAQNKLLKTLEEPENNVYFILTTTNINLVLPTIRSRCVKTELGKLDESQIKSYLGGSENAELACSLSEGLIGRAEKLAVKKELPPLFEGVFSIVTELKASKDILAYSKNICRFSGDSNLIFSALSLIMEDLLYIKSGNESAVRLKSHKNKLEKVKDEYTIKAIVEIRSLIDKAVKEMMFNCNFTVVFENLMLNILEVKYLCR